MNSDEVVDSEAVRVATPVAREPEPPRAAVRHGVDIAVLFVLASAAAGYLSLANPAIRDVVLHGYVLVVGALLMLGIVASASGALPRRSRGDLERALGERRRPEARVPELDRIEREVALATASGYDLHYRLLPHLREIAEARLERRGHRLTEEQAGRWWQLLRPDREPPVEHFGGGISPDDLRELVDDLERM